MYQATDLKLKRSVAIKLLPAEFSSDPERLSGFRREAQVLASLNHPNIAHIYGLEEFGDKRCIVMELVEGRAPGSGIFRLRADEVRSVVRIAGAFVMRLGGIGAQRTLERDALRRVLPVCGSTSPLVVHC